MAADESREGSESPGFATNVFFLVAIGIQPYSFFFLVFCVVFVEKALRHSCYWQSCLLLCAVRTAWLGEGWAWALNGQTKSTDRRQDKGSHVVLAMLEWTLHKS